MAYYDPRNDKIVGAQCGSWAWYHERRHQKQYKRGVANRLDALNVFMYYAAFLAGPAGLIFGGVRGWFFGIGVPMTPVVLGLAALEFDAYVFGTIDWLKNC